MRRARQVSRASPLYRAASRFSAHSAIKRLALFPYNYWHWRCVYMKRQAGSLTETDLGCSKRDLRKRADPTSHINTTTILWEKKHEPRPAQGSVKGKWTNLGFWETAHLPLTQPNILPEARHKCQRWVRGGVGGQFPKNLHRSGKVTKRSELATARVEFWFSFKFKGQVNFLNKLTVSSFYRSKKESITPETTEQ